MPTKARQLREAARLQQQALEQARYQRQAEELARLRDEVRALQDGASHAPAAGADPSLVLQSRLEGDPRPAGVVVVTNAAVVGPGPLDTPSMVGPWDRTKWLFGAEALPLRPDTAGLPWQLVRCVGCNGEMWRKVERDNLCEQCLFQLYSDDIDHAARQTQRLGSILSRTVDPFR